jgi:3',5'-nucleoside bisphosphate phosphatase
MNPVTQPFCADLHCHSTVSDGVFAPDEIAHRAKNAGVTLWSLTDHDELSGQKLAMETARQIGLQYLTGVEISVTWAHQTVHIVGLGVDPEDATLTEGLRRTRAGRADRAKRIGDRLEALGMPGAFEGALPFAGNPELISRTHFARYLVQAGYFTEVQDVFDRLLKDDGPAHEPMQWASLGAALTWIRGAGGVSVIAHPGRYRYTATQFGAFFEEFKDLGGQGIEVVTGSHTPAQFKEYAQIARHYGFQASCGSDFHSPNESRVQLGGLPALPGDLTPVWHGLV